MTGTIILLDHRGSIVKARWLRLHLMDDAFKEAQNVEWFVQLGSSLPVRQDNEPRLLPTKLIRSPASPPIPKILASRMLPPIVRTSPPSLQTPVATFFHVPRRYVKSNMQVGDDSRESPMDDAKPSRNLRKSSRIHETRSAPTSNPTAERTKKDEQPMSPTSSSPRATRKRLASLIEVAQREDSSSPTEDKPPPSATSTTAGSPDFSGHVCICQPEPKIPRPRNGKSVLYSLCSEYIFFPVI